VRPLSRVVRTSHGFAARTIALALAALRREKEKAKGPDANVTKDFAARPRTNVTTECRRHTLTSATGPHTKGNRQIPKRRGNA